VTIYGAALLAGCFIVGQFIGQLLGVILGVNSNIGGVGFAMLLLIVISTWALKKGYMKPADESGITFWSSMYIPIVVAMSSIQNVVAALSGGVVAILGGILAVAIGFAIIPMLAGKPKRTTLEEALARMEAAKKAAAEAEAEVERLKAVADTEKEGE